MMDNIVGRNIKYLRKKMGMTQKELADALGKSNTTIQGYENGYREPSIQTIRELSDILKTNPSALLGFCERTTLTDRIDELLGARSMSRRELASLAGIPSSTLQSSMEEDCYNISLWNAIKIANAFGLPIGELIRGVDW